MNDDHLVYFECLPLFVGETLDMLVPSSVRVWIFLEVASSRGPGTSGCQHTLELATEPWQSFHNRGENYTGVNPL